MIFLKWEKKLSLQTVDFKNSDLKRLKSHLSKSIMIFWNVILVNHLYFVWNETEINVTFHFCRLRQSTPEKYREYKWVIFRVDKCMDTFCIRIFYYSISQGFYSTIFYCRGLVSTRPWLSLDLSPFPELYQYCLFNSYSPSPLSPWL